jgi:hypothetical protein
MSVILQRFIINVNKKKKKKKTPAIFELLVPERIIRPVVSASALTWYIIYIYFLKFTVPR